MKKVQVLGGGCEACNQLALLVQKTAADNGIEIDFSKVSDEKEIRAMGALMTPALAVDGEIKAGGKVPPADKILSFLQ